MLKLLFIFIFGTHLANARELTSRKKIFNKDKEIGEILTKIFYEEIYKRTYRIKPPLAVAMKKRSAFAGKKGKLLIEQMKQKNRERIALKRGIHPSKVKTAKDMIKLAKEDNRAVIQKMNAAEGRSRLSSKAIAEIAALKIKVLKEHRAWRNKHLPTLKEWEAQREEYLDLSSFDEQTKCVHNYI